jgi:hypothetical protein
MGLLDLFRKKRDAAASRDLADKKEVYDRANLRVQNSNSDEPSHEGMDSNFGMDTNLDKFDRAEVNYKKAKANYGGDKSLFRKKEDKESKERRKYNDASIDLAYKKAAFERAELRVQQSDNSNGPYSNKGIDSNFGMDSVSDKHSKAKGDYYAAKNKVDKLYEQSEVEAHRLDEQRDYLVSQFGKDSREVYNFERKKLGMHQKKESKLVAMSSIIALIGGLFFLSPDLTGNVIGQASLASNAIGGVLFIAGIVGAFFYIRRK